MTVEFAETGERAIDVIGTKHFDLILLDVVLPGIDGYKVCKLIKRDKLKKQIPVIMLTGKSSPFDHVKGALAGADTYLNKPVNQITFDKAVSRYLSKVVGAELRAVPA